MKKTSPMLKSILLGRGCNTVYLCEIDHPAGVVRLNSGVNSVFWGDDEFIALGKMGNITGLTQSMDMKSQEVTLSMAAPIMSDAAQQLLTQPVKGRLAFVWQAFLDDDWRVIEGIPDDVIQLANITLDSVDVSIDESNVHVLSLKGYMTQHSARRAATVYYSNEWQQSRFPGDTGLDRMASLADKVV